MASQTIQAAAEVTSGKRTAPSECDLSLLYCQLKEIAASYMQGERVGHTLQATALLHEALLRLGDWSGNSAPGSADYCAAASNTMRRILVDHARRKNAQKRGGQWVQIALEQAEIPALGLAANEVLDMDDAIDELSNLNERHAQVVQLRFFNGLSVAETAAVLAVSPATIKKDWRLARAWLLSRLGERDER